MSCCNNDAVTRNELILLVNKSREAAACAEANCGSSFTNAANAATSATNAANSATAAAASAAAAATSETNTENLWEQFNALYLGSFAVAPTTDNEGNPLQEGALYWNSVSNTMFAWDGSAWATATNFNEFTNFTATGTTTARNLVTRFADVVNVKDFGAVGDGVADDTAAIQAALNLSQGKQVFIPEGIYKITSQLNAQDRSTIYGDNRDTSIFQYSGSSTITNGSILKFSNKSAIAVHNLGFRCTDANIANNTIMLHLEDCVYFNVTDLSFGAPSVTGQNSLIGIKCDQTTSGFVPPRGNGVFRNILYVVEPPDSGSNLSVGIWVKGHASQAMNHITFDGEGGIEHAYYGIKLENANNCHIANWQMRGSTFTEIALVNSSNNIIVAPAIIPPPIIGIGISLDTNCFDNTIISPAWNFSSGTPLAAISDNGNRTVIINQSAVGSLTPKNKFNGSFEFRKPDGIGATASFIRSITDTDNGVILRSDYLPINKAFLTINRGSGPSGNDIARYEGGTQLFERVDSTGQRFIRTFNSVPPDGDLDLSQCTFYVDQATNELKVKVKYTTGTVKIGSINLI